MSPNLQPLSPSAAVPPMARYSLLNPWPREALQFAAALERAGRWLLAARRGLSASYGLTVAEWRMLRAIRESSAEPSIAALARRLDVTRQTAQRTAVGLQESGWLRLGPRNTDRRILVASLTAAGEAWLAELESTMRALLLEMTNDLSPQTLEIMSDALARLARRLRSCRSILRASNPGHRRRQRVRKTRQLS
jgi:DNA-binding MarR family transcriptional regulator